jgi:hypothetical protein
MAGIEPTAIMKYPVLLTDKDWQKKKGLMAKSVKTGLKAELDKGEALHAKIDTSLLYPARDAPKSLEDLEKGLKEAKDYYKSHVEPLRTQLREIETAAAKAAVALTKAKYPDAAKAALAIEKAADLFGVTCKSIDFEDDYKKGLERIAKLNMLAAKLLKDSIKKFLVSAKAYLNSDGTQASWDDLVKQNGRSVSNSVRQLANYNAEFWGKFKMFQGFDLATMKLTGDVELTIKKRAVVVKEAIKQVDLIDAFEP